MRALQWAASPSACRSVLSVHMRLELHSSNQIIPVVIKADSALLLASSKLNIADMSARRH